MPIYTFECSKCETVYDHFLKIGEPYDDLACPECGAVKPKKRVTAFQTNSWSSFLDGMERRVSPEKFK
ncbi:MAG: zinc ribbon domain-containing protein [Syntrophaceae bacterium]|nr:zinc ribbon domain-containing protein [Syntrophaceae bacterium]